MGLPKLLIHDKKSPLYNVAYLLRPLDKEEKEKHIFQGEGGSEHTLYIPTEFINNTINAFPTTGVVVAAYGDNPDFSPGDVVVCEQNVFRSQERKFKDWQVFWDDPEHGELYRAFNIDVYVKINDDGTLTPRTGVIICDPVYRKNYETTLSIELPDSAKTNRRDCIRASILWPGCTEYSVGDYLYIQRGGDWRFKLKGVDYIKTDTLFNDVIASAPDDKWNNNTIDHRIF